MAQDQQTRNTANVAVEIDWYQAIKALRKLAETREVERFSLEDVGELATIGKIVCERIMERDKEKS